jgi:hypothetical protein
MPLHLTTALEALCAHARRVRGVEAELVAHARRARAGREAGALPPLPPHAWGEHLVLGLEAAQQHGLLQPQAPQLHQLHQLHISGSGSGILRGSPVAGLGSSSGSSSGGSGSSGSALHLPSAHHMRTPWQPRDGVPSLMSRGSSSSGGGGGGGGGGSAAVPPSVSSAALAGGVFTLPPRAGFGSASESRAALSRFSEPTLSSLLRKDAIKEAAGGAVGSPQARARAALARELAGGR